MRANDEKFIGSFARVVREPVVVGVLVAGGAGVFALPYLFGTRPPELASRSDAVQASASSSRLALPQPQFSPKNSPDRAVAVIPQNGPGSKAPEIREQTVAAEATPSPLFSGIHASVARNRTPASRSNSPVRRQQPSTTMAEAFGDANVGWLSPTPPVSTPVEVLTPQAPATPTQAAQVEEGPLASSQAANSPAPAVGPEQAILEPDAGRLAPQPVEALAPPPVPSPDSPVEQPEIAAAPINRIESAGQLAGASDSGVAIPEMAVAQASPVSPVMARAAASDAPVSPAAQAQPPYAPMEAAPANVAERSNQATPRVLAAPALARGEQLHLAGQQNLAVDPGKQNSHAIAMQTGPTLPARQRANTAIASERMPVPPTIKLGPAKPLARNSLSGTGSSAKRVHAGAGRHAVERPEALSGVININIPTRINGMKLGSVPLRIESGNRISVGLGGILAMIQPVIDRRVFDRLSNSRGATEFVTFETLRAAGIEVRFDPINEQLLLGATG